MKNYEITWISINDYYDRPLNGWIQLSGHRHRLYFEIDEVGDFWNVYNIPKELAIVALKQTHDFRNMVTWYNDSDPRGINEKSGALLRSYDEHSPASIAFYDRAPFEFDRSMMGEVIGRSDDLLTVTCS